MLDVYKRQALKDKDYGEAFTAAHTLKGVTANMGLTPLFDRVCAIVEPLRLGEAREDYPDMYREIEDEDVYKRQGLCRLSRYDRGDRGTRADAQPV